MIAFRLPEEPFGWQRAGHSGHHYTSKATRAYENKVRALCMDVMRRAGLSAFDVPVVIELTFWLCPPASWSNKRRRACLDGERAITGRYDWDNLAKAICDALNKVAYLDDRLIVGAVVWKRASETVGVDVRVRAYEPTDRLEGDRRRSGDQGGLGRAAVQGASEGQGEPPV